MRPSSPAEAGFLIGMVPAVRAAAPSDATCSAVAAATRGQGRFKVAGAVLGALLGLLVVERAASANEVVTLIDNTQIAGKLSHYYDGTIVIETSGGQKVEFFSSTFHVGLYTLDLFLDLGFVHICHHRVSCEIKVFWFNIIAAFRLAHYVGNGGLLHDGLFRFEHRFRCNAMLNVVISLDSTAAISFVYRFLHRSRHLVGIH